MKQLARIYQFLFNPEVKQHFSISETKRIKLTSFITSCGILITLFYLFVFILVGLTPLIIVDLSFIFISLIVLFINVKGYHIAARVLFLSCLYIQFMVLSFLFGEEALPHILFIPSAAAALVMFDFRYAKTIIFYIVAGFAAGILVYALHVPALGWMNFSPELIHNLKISFIITAILGEVLVIYSLVYNFNLVE